jgi:uncharacterized coiled-coil DUF342 family protein
MKLFRSKIDKLINKKEGLANKKQKIKDIMYETNSKIETKLKRYENLAQRNKADADNKINDINREIDKITKLIDVEKTYVQGIENSETTDSKGV